MNNLPINKIIKGDCLEIMKDIPNNSIDLVVTDPPYGISYGEWDNIEFNNFTEQWVRECFRVLKNNGTMWSFMGYQRILEFIPLLRKYGYVYLENWVVWARQKGRCSSKHLKSQREDIFHITKSNQYVWNNLKVLREVVCPYVKDGKPRGWFINEQGKRVRWTGLGNVWVYTSPQYNSKTDKQVHPAQKPLMLMERLILLSSNEGDLILDPFIGSGTTVVACIKLKRNFIGIEKDEKYFKIAEERIKENTTK
ncbi:MAG TPA: site-specific DNA-methyltransferase [Candidatus Diapherotrites archaeon]|nr:site-specific DNA-methyltransferase [Candidatus Diapherotrites archaeon]